MQNDNRVVNAFVVNIFMHYIKAPRSLGLAPEVLVRQMQPQGQGSQFLSISTFLVSRRQTMPTIKLTPVIATGYHSP
ncbi:hypothetical protein PS691_00848 [Pseudomonas fluorescens]|uniref:Uncharacterized protein n=1 Tax=Pseudomonas fluorescens TaxID=294 RepID=A0A5E7AJ00_PSEFL|nr:hypothetical protein PS691_00848 [Pseudomonas fluorescens]